MQPPPGYSVREHGGHAPAGRQRAQEASAFSQQPEAVVQLEHACDTGRGVLPHAVAQHDVGLEAPGLPQARQAHLQREQRRLGIGSVVDRLRIART